jgi:hypothetical protein
MDTDTGMVTDLDTGMGMGMHMDTGMGTGMDMHPCVPRGNFGRGPI